MSENVFAEHNILRFTKANTESGQEEVHVYLRPNDPSGGRKTGLSDLKADQCLFLFAECDARHPPTEGEVVGKPVTIDEQVEVFSERTGLGTMAWFTGGKSVWVTWRLSGGMKPAVAKALQLLLVRKLGDNPYGTGKFADTQVVCPSHMVRAPLTVHGETGKKGWIINASDKTYDVQDLEAFPLDKGRGSHSTVPACGAVKYLLNKGTATAVVRDVAKLHGWDGELVEKKFLDSKARNSIIASDREAAGETGSGETTDVETTLDQIDEVIKAAVEGGGPRERQCARAELLLRKATLERKVSDRTIREWLSTSSGMADGELVLETSFGNFEGARYTGPFYSGQLNLLTASAKVGKTWLMGEFCRRALSGRDETFAGKPVLPVKDVLFVSLDQGFGSNMVMLSQLGLIKQKAGSQGFEAVPGFVLAQRGAFSFDVVKRWSSAHPGALIVVDSLTKITPSSISEGEAEMGRFLSGFQDAPGEPTTVVIHHAGKKALEDGATGQEVIRGSGSILGAVAWSVIYETPMKKPHGSRWQCVRESPQRRLDAVGRDLDDFRIYIDSRTYEPGPGDEFEDGEENGPRELVRFTQKSPPRPVDDLRTRILTEVKARPGEMGSIRSIARVVGVHEKDKKTENVIKEMMDVGVLVKKGKWFEVKKFEANEDQREIVRTVLANPGAEFEENELLEASQVLGGDEDLRILFAAGVLYKAEGRIFCNAELLENESQMRLERLEEVE